MYGFVDSLDTKYFVFNLTLVGNSKILNKPNVEVEKVEEPSTDIDECYQLILRWKKSSEEQFTCDKIINEEIKLNNNRAYLIVEKYNWQKEEIGSCLLSLETVGSKSAVLELPKGRHTFRLWIRSDTPYVCNVLCDTPFTLGTSEEVLVAMLSEAQTFQKFIIDFCSNYGKLVQAFGRSEFRDQKWAFHRTYISQCLTKNEKLHVHEFMFNTLIKEVVNYMEKSQHKNLIRALHIFFRRIYFDPEYRICKTLDKFSDVDVKFYKLLERSSVKIQAIFKGIYVRSILNRHRSEHPEHLTIFELCKKVYTSLMSSKSRMNIGPQIFRRFLFSEEMNDIFKKYEIYEDMQSVVTIIDFKGHQLIKENGWAIVCRQVFYINCPVAVPIKIQFYIKNCSYMVRVFDNDTFNELSAATCNVLPATYDVNRSGYTVVCYGYSKTEFNYPWRLMLVTLKTQYENKILIQPRPLQIQKIIENYIPSNSHTLFHCMICIQTSSVVSFRLVSSHERACMSLTLRYKKRILKKVNGIGKVLIPSFILVHEDSDSMSDSQYSNKRRKSKISTGTLKKGSEKASRASGTSIQKVVFKSERQGDKTGPETIYLLEAKVKKGSWPLSLEEWDMVETIKKSQLIAVEDSLT